MPTVSPHQNLWVFSTADTYSTARENDNWLALDSSPGTFICTVSTRPTTWGIAQSGMRIYETDSTLTWRWTGTQFVRVGGQGFLGRSTSTTPLSTSSTWTPGAGTGLITVVNVVVSVPAAGPGPSPRWLMVIAELPKIQNTVGVCYLALKRDTTVLTWWQVPATIDGTPSGQGRASTWVTLDQPSTTSSTYSIMCASVPGVGFGGTTTITAAAGQPVALTVAEL